MTDKKNQNFTTKIKTGNSQILYLTVKFCTWQSSSVLDNQVQNFDSQVQKLTKKLKIWQSSSKFDNQVQNYPFKVNPTNEISSTTFLLIKFH